MATDSIVAIATASGKGGIGVVRVSGPSAPLIAQSLCSKPLKPREAVYCDFLDADQQALDRGIGLLFVAPHSFTGEHVLELQAHGGPVVLQMLVRRVLQVGRQLNEEDAQQRVRLAEPGEFTRRAYLNDKLDLAQAEAVADLIEAQTEQAARLANRSLQGEFSARIAVLNEQLVRLRMLVEATLDFPEEEIDFLQNADAFARLDRLEAALSAIFKAARLGALLRNGLNVVLVGSPNVGKSSLLNALAGAEVAIVTPIAGTTRDKVVQAIQIEGIALNIIDTAGIRDLSEAGDVVEKIGIERTWKEVEAADLVLHLTAPDQADDGQLLVAIRERLAQGKLADDDRATTVPVLEVYNKVDLGEAAAPAGSIAISARENIGLAQLREAILQAVGWQADAGDLVLARERQLLALQASLAHVAVARQLAARGNAALELLAEELTQAQRELNTILGEFTADDLLGEIFSRFCIGK